MEMTGSQEILIPLMATAFFATGTSKLINPLPLYRELCNSYIQPKKLEPENVDSTDHEIK
jgi:H+/Cl- antiporter ClcA